MPSDAGVTIPELPPMTTIRLSLISFVSFVSPYLHSGHEVDLADT
jgi:hypothetical protein